MSTESPPTVTVADSDPPGREGCSLVVGFDRTDASRGALQHAAVLGDRLRASLAVVHAVDLDDFPVDPDADDWERAARNAVRVERETVTEILNGYRWGWTFRVTTTRDPASALVSTATALNAEMIIVGTRGEGWRRTLDRIVSPSVSHRVIAVARCPVLVVGDGVQA